MKAEEFIFEEDIPEMIDGKPTRNSNGKYIHPTIDGIRNFWKWFGDSKVVDEQGRPLVLYHGTTKLFTDFDNNLQKTGWVGKGVYFTPSKDVANSFGKKLIQVYLKITNPYITTEDDPSMVYSEVSKQYGVDGNSDISVPLKHHGFDGVIFTHWDIGKMIVAFNSNQIKSASGNKGTFSPNSNNITESVNLPEMIDGKPTKNSEGKPIHHSEDGIRNFWKWFGDSRTVDSQGRPLTFYHATNNDFEGFDLSKGYGIAGQGVYLTNNRPTDDKYGNFVMPLYAKMSKRIDFSEGDSKINELALKLGMDALYDLNSFAQIKEWSKQLRDNLIKHGFDSSILKGEGSEQYYVVYHPENVKSALGNKGGYSINSSNITEDITKDTIWYHASDVADIIDFDDTKLKNEKFGHFFTDDPDTVKGIYGSHVYSRKIEVTNPFTISQDKWNSIREAHHGDSGYFKQFRDNIVSKGHDALLVNTRNIQFGRFDIREPNILVVFDASKIKPITSKITEALKPTVKQEISKLEKRIANLEAYLRIVKEYPSEVPLTKDSYEYYDEIQNDIDTLQAQLQDNRNKLSTNIPASILSNPKFRTWFRGSKVVDEMGNPLPVYHGSNADFQSFSHVFNASSTNAAQFGAGFYFTTNPRVASGYADQRKDSPVVYKVYLNIKKPIENGTKKKLSTSTIRSIILQSPTLEDSLSNFGDVQYEGKQRVLRNAIENYYEYQEDGMLPMLYALNNDFFSDNDEAFTTAVTKSTGYDGIQVNLKDTTHWIAFFSWQVKSALGNKGTYSKKSGNITEALENTTDPRLTRAEEMGYDTNKVWWHGSFSNFTEFDPNRSGSSSFHFSSERDFAEDYAHTKATDMGSDEDVYVRGFYLPKNLFDYNNPDHIQQLEKVLPKEISIQGRYGWAAFGGAASISKEELIERIQGIQYPYTGIEDSQKEKIRNGAEYFSREGSNERVIDYDAVNDVVEWVPGWEYQDIEGLKNNIKWAIQNFGEDDFRVRQYEIQLKNKQEKLRTRKTELSPQKRDGFDNWSLMEAPELKPYFKKLGFEGALMQERKKLNVAIFDSNRIRSVNAEFNPKFKNSSDIMQ